MEFSNRTLPLGASAHAIGPSSSISAHKYWLLLCVACLLSLSASAYTFTWTGTQDSDWTDGSNWSGGSWLSTWPNDTDDLITINQGTPNPCILDQDRTFERLSLMSGGYLDLGGNTLTITGSGSTTGVSILSAATLENGELKTKRFGTVSYMTFLGDVIFNYTGTNNINWQGNNTYEKVTFIKSGSNNWQIASAWPDIFNGEATFSCSSSGPFFIGNGGDVTFNDNVYFDSNNSFMQFRLGGYNSNISIASGKALLHHGLGDGEIYLRNVTQDGVVPNGSFTPKVFHVTDCTLGGDITITGADEIQITDSELQGANELRAESIEINTSDLSMTSGSTTIERASGNSSSDSWDGGNNISNFTLINNSTGQIRTNTSFGSLTDNFYGTTTVANNSSGYIRLGSSGQNIVHGNLFLSGVSFNLGSIYIGSSQSSVQMNAGASLDGSNYINGRFYFYNFTQVGTADNASFSSRYLYIYDSTFNSPISIDANESVHIQDSDLESSVYISSPEITLYQNVSLSTTSGSAEIIKTNAGGSNNDWRGGNSYGPITIRNQASWGNITMAQLYPDTFYGPLLVIQENTGAITVAFSGENIFYDNISTVGSTASIPFGGFTGICTMAGSSTQTIDGDDANPPYFKRLRMNTSAAVSLILDVPITVEVHLDLQNGTIETTATNLITCLNGATTGLGSASSHIDGPMARELVNNSGTGAALNFPIGKNGDWRPVTLTIGHTSTSDNYTYISEVFDQSATDLAWSNAPTINRVSDYHYWDIDRYYTPTMALEPATGIDLSVGNEPRIELYYDLADAVTDPTNLRIVKNTTSAPTSWIDIGGTGASIGTGSVTSTSSPSLFDSFSRFTLANSTGGANPLPIQLLSFKANPFESNVLTSWSTASEIDNDFFIIERSRDALFWESVGVISGNGSSSSVTDYELVDLSPYNGQSYYRLSQVDYNGETKSFDPVAVYVQHSVARWSFYPNPSKETVTLQLDDAKASDWELYDLTGRSRKASTEIIEQSENLLRIDISNLSSGIYLLEVNGEGAQLIIE